MTRAADTHLDGETEAEPHSRVLPEPHPEGADLGLEPRTLASQPGALHLDCENIARVEVVWTMALAKRGQEEAGRIWGVARLDTGRGRICRKLEKGWLTEEARAPTPDLGLVSGHGLWGQLHFPFGAWSSCVLRAIWDRAQGGGAVGEGL